MKKINLTIIAVLVLGSSFISYGAQAATQQTLTTSLQLQTTLSDHSNTRTLVPVVLEQTGTLQDGVSFVSGDTDYSCSQTAATFTCTGSNHNNTPGPTTEPSFTFDTATGKITGTNGSRMTTAQLQVLIDALTARLAELLAQRTGGTVALSVPTQPLTIGSRGAEVIKLQNFLSAKGYSIAAGATGYFGAQTKAALVAWQKASGLSGTGYYGPLSSAKASAQLGK